MAMTELHDVIRAQQGRPPRGMAVLVMALVAALAVGATITLSTRRAGASHSTDADRVRDLDRTLRTALVAGDITTAEVVLAPHFELIDPSGDRQTRDQYLSTVSSGDLSYQAFDRISPVDVQVSGDIAVVTYESQLQVSSGDIQVSHRAWHTHVYQQFASRWRQVWSQTTAVGGFPPPGAHLRS